MSLTGRVCAYCMESIHWDSGKGAWVPYEPEGTRDCPAGGKDVAHWPIGYIERPTIANVVTLFSRKAPGNAAPGGDGKPSPA